MAGLYFYTQLTRTTSSPFYMAAGRPMFQNSCNCCKKKNRINKTSVPPREQPSTLHVFRKSITYAIQAIRLFLKLISILSAVVSCRVTRKPSRTLTTFFVCVSAPQQGREETS